MGAIRMYKVSRIQTVLIQTDDPFKAAEVAHNFFEGKATDSKVGIVHGEPRITAVDIEEMR